MNDQQERQERLVTLLDELFSWSIQVLGVPVLFGIKPQGRTIQLHRLPDGVGIPIYVPRGYHSKFVRHEKELRGMAIRSFPEYEAEFQQVPPILYLKEKQLRTQSFRFKFNDDKPFTVVIGVEPKNRVIPKIPLAHPEYSHVLVAGATGSGKTNTIQSIILSACWNTSPEDLRLILLDPKFTGLEPLARLPHTEIFSYDIEAISRILVQVKEEVQQRIPARRNRPYIMVVIEELAEITTHPVYGKTLRDEVLPTLGRLGREFDVRLVAGTQKPTTDVVGSQLRQQFGIRFIGRLESDRESSWLIEDSKFSARKLPGKGLMLYRVGPMDYEMIQVARVADKDQLVDAIIDKYSSVPAVKGLLPELTEERLEEAEVVPIAVNELRKKMEAYRGRWIKEGKLTVSLTKACEVLGVNVKNRTRRLEVKELLEKMLTEELTDE